MKTVRSLFLFLLIIWILGEILTRLFFPLDPQSRHTLDRSSQHPYIRTDWVPGFQTTYVIEGIAGQRGKMEFKINEFGFRSSSMKTAQRPPRTTRIFFLGGSTTEEIYLPEEKTFPYLIEKKLKDTFPNRNFECVNNGISGYLTADVLAALIYKVMYYEPDVVVVMLGGANDLRYGAVPFYDPVQRTGYQKILYSPEFKGETWKAIARFFKQSHFLTLIKWRLLNRIFPPDAEKFKTKLEEYNHWRTQRRRTPFTPVMESKAMGDFLKNLEEIIFITRGHNIRLILVTEPFIYQENMSKEIEEKLWMGYMPESGVNLSNEFLLKEMKRFNDAVRNLSKKYGVELIDLEREIPKDLAHFYDDVHFSPEGAKRAARAVNEYLILNQEKLPG